MNPPNKPDSNALIPPPENSAEITEAFRVLSQADKVEVPRMPERMFIEHLLPLLSTPAGQRVELDRWLDVAGTPLRPIDIVDNVTGEVLFRLPPLMRTLPTVFQEEMRYSEIITETQAHERVMPIRGEAYLQQQLARVRTGATLVDVDTANQWNSIRQRYGLPLLPVMGKDGQPLLPASSHTDPSASSGTLQVTDDQDDFF